MKFSETLFERTKDLWDEAAEKPFVLDMAKGTLPEVSFRYYMLQDYLYLYDYIGILEGTFAHTDDPEQQRFLSSVIEDTKHETTVVHVPNMKKTGVTDEDILSGKRADIIVEYVSYMRQQLNEEGLLAGLTALLQCSWVYAYIGKVVSEKYPEEIAASEYGSWFAAYTDQGYIDANQKWIDVVDEETESISGEEAEKLCAIFRTCAEYENKLWDVLHEH